MSDIKLIDARITKDELKRLLAEGFKDMVKPDIDGIRPCLNPCFL